MKNKDRFFYPAVFSYEDGEEISVFFPDLDVATSGVNEDDAFLSARELLGCVIYGLEQDKSALPAPSRVTDIVAADNERVMLIDVYMPPVRLSQKNKAVNRTVTLPAWLNAAALAENINFSQLLQEAIKHQLGINN